MSQETPAERLMRLGGVGGRARQQGNPGGQRARRGGHQERGRQPRGGGLPEGYLKGGYFDDQDNLRPELVTDWAKEVARALRPSSREGINSHQLRRFFHKARHIQQRLKSGQSFESLVAEIRKFEPMALSAVARGNAPEVFREFMERNVPLACKSRKAFEEGFLSHFEAVVAYFTYLESQSGRR